MARERRKPGKNDRKRIPKKKTSILVTENITYVDYKDVNLLRRFMSERAKIRARRVTGNSQQQQVEVARAIRIAREMALLPYSLRQVTQRNKGGPRGRDRGGRRDRGMPPESVPGSSEAPKSAGGAGAAAVGDARPAGNVDAADAPVADGDDSPDARPAGNVDAPAAGDAADAVDAPAAGNDGADAADEAGA